METLLVAFMSLRQGLIPGRWRGGCGSASSRTSRCFHVPRATEMSGVISGTSWPGWSRSRSSLRNLAPPPVPSTFGWLTGTGDPSPCRHQLWLSCMRQVGTRTFSAPFLIPTFSRSSIARLRLAVTLPLPLSRRRDQLAARWSITMEWRERKFMSCPTEWIIPSFGRALRVGPS